MYQSYQGNYPYEPSHNNGQNPTHIPHNPNWQACRDRCSRLGFQPGTIAWQNCVHGCMGSNPVNRK